MKLFLLFLILSFSTFSKGLFLGFRHLHNGKAHKAESYMSKRASKILSKGRVNLYRVTDKKFSLKTAPEYVQEQFFQIELSDLQKNPVLTKVRAKPQISLLLQNLNLNTYKAYVESLVSIGSRSRGAEAKSYLVSELQKIGLNPIRSDYNIISFMKGQSEKAIVVIGHMDTVSRTVGADDNASGASGVLELARTVSLSLKGSTPKKSIYFILSEDEENGLLGAKKFVKRMKSEGKLKNIELAINMDMIAYNSNGVLDLETNKKNEELANEFAQKTINYTSLKPNLVLNPWGSDHIPFLQNDVPAILTIESWKDHTPCWHKSCDTIETLNFKYALEVLKVNLAVILERVL